jgi:hypothetical protein
MPDINLDTLFIVGLILASLIGKFFKKKEPTDSSETSADSETSLESVLKDAWQKATQSSSKQKETPPPLPGSNLSSDKTIKIDRPPALVATSPIKTASEFTRKESPLDTTWNSPDKKVKRINNITYKELLSSKASLKQAFILREILDQPVSIRPEGQ